MDGLVSVPRRRSSPAEVSCTIREPLALTRGGTWSRSFTRKACPSGRRVPSQDVRLCSAERRCHAVLYRIRSPGALPVSWRVYHSIVHSRVIEGPHGGTSMSCCGHARFHGTLWRTAKRPSCRRLDETAREVPGDHALEQSIIRIRSSMSNCTSVCVGSKGRLALALTVQYSHTKGKSTNSGLKLRPRVGSRCRDWKGGPTRTHLTWYLTRQGGKTFPSREKPVDINKQPQVASLPHGNLQPAHMFELLADPSGLLRTGR